MRPYLLAACCTCIFSGVQPIFAQIIQLPTFHTFSIATTVSIPDRGSMSLGGVDRASFGRAGAGVPGLGGIPGAGRLFGNRGIGAGVQSAGASATATIMDLQELDQSVQAQATSKDSPEPTNPAVARKAAFLTQHIARTDKSLLAGKPTAAATRVDNLRQPPAAPRDPESEAREAYQLAQRAEAQGQLATARVNYKRAAVLSQGRLRAEALAKLAAISAPVKRSKSSTR